MVKKADSRKLHRDSGEKKIVEKKEHTENKYRYWGGGKQKKIKEKMH